MQNILLKIVCILENAKKKSMFQQNERILTISQNQTTTTPPTTQTTTRSTKTHPPPPRHSIDHSNPQIAEGKTKKCSQSQPTTHHNPQTQSSPWPTNHSSHPKTQPSTDPQTSQLPKNTAITTTKKSSHTKNAATHCNSKTQPPITTHKTSQKAQINRNPYSGN